MIQPEMCSFFLAHGSEASLLSKLVGGNPFADTLLSLFCCVERPTAHVVCGGEWGVTVVSRHRQWDAGCNVRAYPVQETATAIS